MRLAQSPDTDLRAAASLPASYVFPHRPADLMVLRAVVGRREEDGTAHLLPEDNPRRRLLRLNPMNSLFLWIAATEPLTVRIDLR